MTWKVDFINPLLLQKPPQPPSKQPSGIQPAAPAADNPPILELLPPYIPQEPLTENFSLIHQPLIYPRSNLYSASNLAYKSVSQVVPSESRNFSVKSLSHIAQSQQDENQNQKPNKTVQTNNSPESSTEYSARETTPLHKASAIHLHNPSKYTLHSSESTSSGASQTINLSTRTQGTQTMFEPSLLQVSMPPGYKVLKTQPFSYNISDYEHTRNLRSLRPSPDDSSNTLSLSISTSSAANSIIENASSKYFLN